ncbi:hypothetical protein GCM10011575_24930 [Microlunatus endophyticus]|uniref:Uncharacterized protein n=1 Tax=Microlunatus endophyticus TaxID=1716077 RepID=A0A917S990_9ACTN|nr:hypothetical protein [Microlunatus endophyticus]GGL65532.1 hypothetical protein GCM10011575_24930 [Microlunatus endophyticus]
MRNSDFPGGFGPNPGRPGPGRRGPDGRGGGRGRRRDDFDNNDEPGPERRRHRGGHPGHPGPPFFEGGPEALREFLSDPANVPWGRGGRRRGPRGFGRPGGWQQSDLPPADDATDWFSGRLPADWFSTVDVTVDREEIVVVGTLADTDQLTGAEAEGRISRFRSESRDTRMQIAEEAQSRYGRKVSWGAAAGDAEDLFTNVSVPVMTRLRQPERRVLDTLVDAGVARSRSEALSWAVKLVGEHTETWLTDLRAAMAEVDKLRSQGPNVGSDDTDESGGEGED